MLIRLYRLWFTFLLASYQHDLLRAAERIEAAKEAYNVACMNIAFAEDVLRELEQQ